MSTVPAAGDIVLFEGHTWDVLSATTLGNDPERPTVQLRLTRQSRAEASTPYGRPQRYKTVTLTRLAAAGRCRLVARQAGLF